MQDVLAKLNGGEVIGLVAVVMGCLTGMSAIIGGFWYGVRKTEAESALKRELLAAGLSADDIERVVNVTTGGATMTELTKARLAAQTEQVKARGW